MDRDGQESIVAHAHLAAPISLSSAQVTSPYDLRVVSLTLLVWLCMIHSNT